MNSEIFYQRGINCVDLQYIREEKHDLPTSLKENNKSSFMRKSIYAFPLLLIIPLTILVLGFFHSGKKEATSVPTGFALVELYTSEGCSSCPPADEVLIKIKKEYPSKVYLLGFHVDYWNSQGWKDMYSDAAYSKRQQEYATVFGLNSIYTPQMVVNGQVQFVGSDEAKLRTCLESQLKINVVTDIKATAAIIADGGVLVTYQLNPLQDMLLHVALIQFHASTSVKKGENAGKNLQHVNLVRDLRTVMVAQGKTIQGSVKLNIPAGLSAADCGIIAFVQERQSMQVKGATELALE
jgi:hypothetical protein